MSELPQEARDLVAEEEALLARVQSALAAAPKRGTERDTAGLWEQLRELRDEAATASERDLPSLFQQMRAVRALAETAAPRPLPEPASPYFAHLRLKDEKGSRDFLLGRATFIDTAAGVRVVDWRFAPVARIFYRYQVGDEFEEEFPGGASHGTVEARRIVVVERGELTRIIDGRTVLVRERGEWKLSGLGEGGVLGGGAGTSARPGTLGLGSETSRKQGKADITALLDAEQFEALSAGPDRPLLVLGSAGSGKTTVALHRLAKLAFDEPERFPETRMRVVVPEEGLARLAKRLLAPLGLDRLSVQTLMKWLEREAIDTFGGRKLNVHEEPPALVARLKRHPALRPLLLEHLAPLERLGTNFATLRRRLAEILSDSAFLSKVVDAAGDLPRTAVEQTVRYTMLQLATPSGREYEGFDLEALTTLDGRGLAEGTPEALAGTLDAEDLALLLFLRARAGGHVPGDLAHFVLDEAEDVSLYELEILARHLGKSRSCTLAGDEMQQTEAGFAGWDEMLRTLGGRVPASVCRLQVSYRCPRPVVELARQVLGKQAPGEALQAREGVPVGFHHFPDEAQAQLFVANALRDLLDREPEAAVGVVAASEESATRIAEALEGLPQARLVLDGSFTFEPGVDVTDVENAKGLEWDYVIVPDATVQAYPATDEARRRLHVAVTRTSHQLWVLSTGTRSPIVPKPE